MATREPLRYFGNGNKKKEIEEFGNHADNNVEAIIQTLGTPSLSNVKLYLAFDIQ